MRSSCRSLVPVYLEYRRSQIEAIAVVDLLVLTVQWRQGLFFLFHFARDREEGKEVSSAVVLLVQSETNRVPEIQSTSLLAGDRGKSEVR